MSDLLLDRWHSEIVVGDIKAPKPGLIGFRNTIQALELLKYHIDRNSRIAVHCDVDVDGIGSGNIAKTFLRSQGATNVLFIINKDKIHGIQQKHVEYFSKNPIDLLIILDSSTNDIDIIKQFNFDVLVVDHHEIQQNELLIEGEHNKIIVNNMIGNSDNKAINEWLRSKNPDTVENIAEYVADSRMSGGMVLYELLRVYQEAYKTGNVLESLFLFQWVGVTLFSDAILLVSDRNQWYIENTVHSQDVEPCLKTIMTELNKYKATLDKSFIGYTFAPVINKAVRSGFSGQALDIVLNRPSKINDLQVYKEQQKKALEVIPENAVYNQPYIIKDITDTGISKNYTGVIASRLCGDNAKNTVVYTISNDIAIGSFRGKFSSVDYRKFFEDYRPGTFAQGHAAAFGFKLPVDCLNDIMSKLVSIEPTVPEQFYLTAGSVPDNLRGVFHIADMSNFKKLGYFWRLAVANSKLSSQEQLDIIAGLRDARLIEQKGMLYIYDVLGLECKAFEPLNKPLISIYAEYSKNIELYVKNYTL